MTAYELESKIEVNQLDFERLLSYGKVCKSTDQLNVYYDCNGSLSNQAATFRVRFIPKGKPVMTLKIPVSTTNGTRKSLEVERELSAYADGSRPLEWQVDKDLPTEFASHLQNIGIAKLNRIGWMRNRRWILQLADNVSVELDRVTLPDGNVFFEVEIESAYTEVHRQAIDLIHGLTTSARPSHLSKYERFMRALLS